jgi:hypothetical protein
MFYSSEYIASEFPQPVRAAVSAGNDLVNMAQNNNNNNNNNNKNNNNNGGSSMYQLYNVVNDPYEYTNVANDYPELVQTMAARFAVYAAQAVDYNVDSTKEDAAATQAKSTGYWGPWLGTYLSGTASAPAALMQE